MSFLVLQLFHRALVGLYRVIVAFLDHSTWVDPENASSQRISQRGLSRADLIGEAI